MGRVWLFSTGDVEKLVEVALREVSCRVTNPPTDFSARVRALLTQWPGRMRFEFALERLVVAAVANGGWFLTAGKFFYTRTPLRLHHVRQPPPRATACRLPTTVARHPPRPARTAAPPEWSTPIAVASAPSCTARSSVLVTHGGTPSWAPSSTTASTASKRDATRMGGSRTACSVLAISAPTGNTSVLMVPCALTAGGRPCGTHAFFHFRECEQMQTKTSALARQELGQAHVTVAVAVQLLELGHHVAQVANGRLDVAGRVVVAAVGRLFAGKRVPRIERDVAKTFGIGVVGGGDEVEKVNAAVGPVGRLKSAVRRYFFDCTVRPSLASVVAITADDVARSVTTAGIVVLYKAAVRINEKEDASPHPG